MGKRRLGPGGSLPSPRSMKRRREHEETIKALRKALRSIEAIACGKKKFALMTHGKRMILIQDMTRRALAGKEAEDGR